MTFIFFQWIPYCIWGFQTWNSHRKIQQLKNRVKIKDNHSCLSQYEFFQACYEFIPCIAHLTAVVPPLVCVLQKIHLQDTSKKQRITMQHERKLEQAKVTEFRNGPSKPWWPSHFVKCAFHRERRRQRYQSLPDKSNSVILRKTQDFLYWLRLCRSSLRWLCRAVLCRANTEFQHLHLVP